MFDCFILIISFSIIFSNLFIFISIQFQFESKITFSSSFFCFFLFDIFFFTNRIKMCYSKSISSYFNNTNFFQQIKCYILHKNTKINKNENPHIKMLYISFLFNNTFFTFFINQSNNTHFIP